MNVNLGDGGKGEKQRDVEGKQQEGEEGEQRGRSHGWNVKAWGIRPWRPVIEVHMKMASLSTRVPLSVKDTGEGERERERENSSK